MTLLSLSWVANTGCLNSEDSRFMWCCSVTALKPLWQNYSGSIQNKRSRPTSLILFCCGDKARLSNSPIQRSCMNELVFIKILKLFHIMCKYIKWNANSAVFFLTKKHFVMVVQYQVAPLVWTMHLCAQPVSNRFSSWLPSISHLAKQNSCLQNNVKLSWIHWVWGRWDEVEGVGGGCRMGKRNRGRDRDRDFQPSSVPVKLSVTMPLLCTRRTQCTHLNLKS